MGGGGRGGGVGGGDGGDGGEGRGRLVGDNYQSLLSGKV